jgi:hypothetical protein
MGRKVSAYYGEPVVCACVCVCVCACVCVCVCCMGEGGLSTLVVCVWVLPYSVLTVRKLVVSVQLVGGGMV